MYLVHLNLNITIPGEGPKTPIKGCSRQDMIDSINKLNLDKKTHDLLVKEANACPDSALSNFRDNLNNKIKDIRKR